MTRWAITPYRGHGRDGRALVLGRVLRSERWAPADPERGLWGNLRDVWRRIEADPLPHAQVLVRCGEALHELEADDEGFFRRWVRLPLGSRGGWHEVQLELQHEEAAPPVTAPVLVPGAEARFGVISDLDDTVIQSQVTRFVHAARLLLLENARTRLPFPGVAPFYAALSGEGRNPLFFVSSSPWNLYGVIEEFLSVHEIPAAPVLLRDWDLGRSLFRNGPHKLQLIEEILATHPALPFILIGDSGQEDPEIYREVVRAHPGRVPAIYIREVTGRPDRQAAIAALAAELTGTGTVLLATPDTLGAARDAEDHGWVPPGTVDAVAAAMRATPPLNDVPG
ncbi:MAG: App1 family protein [Gemmatimonadaceae bacterium]